MDTKPSVLIISTSNTKPASIIKLITKEPVNNDANIISHPFQIKTKYYTTNINLLGFNDSISDLDKEATFLNTVEAIIIHMDANKPTSLDEVRKWTELFSELAVQPEIKLLLANYCNEQTLISKDDANYWCLDKGFEFVELFPLSKEKTASEVDANSKNCVADEGDLEDAFGEEKVGVERIIEALENNIWSNMEMCEKNPVSDETEEETDQFFELFSNLMSMKSGISSLPTNVRKQCAEQMVTAFWKAIGGDEEELADL